LEPIKNKILIAEDEPELLNMMVKLLSPHFQVLTAEDGQQAKKIIASHDFIFLVLDIHLPKVDGLELCQFISQLDKKNKPHIVISSGDNSQETISRAYAFNIDDYIIKPISPLLFLQRMQHLERDILNLIYLENQRNNSQSIAETAMQQSAEYGSALELISRLNSISDSQLLAREVAKYFESKGYYAAVQLRSAHEIVTFDIDSESCSDNELRVFNILHNQGRIYSFGRRSMFNDEHVSVLIKNMPPTDSHSYGFLVDVAAKIVPAINNRFVSLCNEMAIASGVETLSTAIEMVGTGILAMELEKRSIIDEVIAQINASFHTLELSDKQEAYFVQLIEEKLLKKEVGNQFLVLRDTLDSCLVSIKETQKMSNTSKQESSSDYQDVELF
jgi:DNA-binding response OmpR family regulator